MSRWLWPLALASVGVAVAAEPVAPHDTCGSYLIVPARKLDDLEQKLEKAASEGYRVIGLATGDAAIRQRSRIQVLLEKQSDSDERIQYAVTQGTFKKLEVDVNRFAAEGYRALPRNVFDRQNNSPWWVPLPGDGGYKQTVLIMERPANEPELRSTYRYMSVPLHKPEEFCRTLASRADEGYRLVSLVGGWNGLGALLERPSDSESSVSSGNGSADDRFRLLTRMKRKKLEADLEAVAAQGYRLLDDSYGTVKGGAYSWLIEKVGAPPAVYLYRVLPRRQRADYIDLLNRAGSEGYRVHRAVPGVMERHPDEDGAWHYEQVVSESIEGLPGKLASACEEGDEIISFGPEGAILERRR